MTADADLTLIPCPNGNGPHSWQVWDNDGLRSLGWESCWLCHGRGEVDPAVALADLIAQRDEIEPTLLQHLVAALGAEATKAAA